MTIGVPDGSQVAYGLGRICSDGKQTPLRLSSSRNLTGVAAGHCQETHSVPGVRRN
jgi:hypothetical protein